MSRYLDRDSSEGALMEFIMNAITFFRQVCTFEVPFPELSSFNIVDSNTEDFSNYNHSVSTNKCAGACSNQWNTWFIFQLDFDNGMKQLLNSWMKLCINAGLRGRAWRDFHPLLILYHRYNIKVKLIY